MAEECNGNADSEELIGQEKKIICSTYDRLVKTLAGAMKIDEEKIVGEPESGFNHEDIVSWIGLVDFKDGKAPNIQANLSAGQGKRIIKINVQDQKAVDGTGERATDEELVYSMALIEAKTRVVSEIAEEVHPAISFRINDLRRKMEKVRGGILSNVVENRFLGAVRKIDRLFLVSLALIAAVGLSKSRPIVGRDVVSPAVEAFGKAVRQDYQNEWGGLTPEEVEAREACLSGFSCADWEQLKP